MAKAAAAPVGMEKTELRKHIVLARRAPVHVAFALGGDGKAILMMDKRKPPRAIEKELKEQAADAKNSRFGTLVIDENRPKVARFVVNKAANGMARKLVMALKGTGVREIEVVLEDGTAVESAQHEGEDDEEDLGEEVGSAVRGIGKAVEGVAEGIAEGIEGLFGNGGEEHRRHHRRHRHHRAEEDGEADPETSDGDDAGLSDGSDTGAADASAADAGDADAGDAEAADASAADTDSGEIAAADDTGQPDGAALATTLTGLVKRMMGAIKQDPSQKAALIEMATDARASLKGGDLRQAAAGIDIFQEALDSLGSPSTGQAQDSAVSDADAPAGDAQASGDTPAGDADDGASDRNVARRYKKARDVWMATRTKVDAEIGKVCRQIMATDHGGAFGDDLEQQLMSTVEPILNTLDVNLAHVIGQAAEASDRESAAKLAGEARAMVGRYVRFVASNETIRALDSNPFVNVTVGKMLEASLKALSKSLH